MGDLTTEDDSNLAHNPKDVETLDDHRALVAAGRAGGVRADRPVATGCRADRRFSVGQDRRHSRGCHPKYHVPSHGECRGRPSRCSGPFSDLGGMPGSCSSYEP
jgi:hypothetical protein